MMLRSGCCRHLSRPDIARRPCMDKTRWHRDRVTPGEGGKSGGASGALLTSVQVFVVALAAKVDRTRFRL